MSPRSAIPATFVIERTYDASPARVFAAWSSTEAKSAWFGCDDTWVQTLNEMDFRVGGRERIRNGPAGGVVHAFDAIYHDIVPNERIVYAYDMWLDDRLISISLATIEFKLAGAATKLTLTEQGVFLDGYDEIAEREEGTAVGLDNLGAALARGAV